jgi:hypothetical protein
VNRPRLASGMVAATALLLVLAAAAAIASPNRPAGDLVQGSGFLIPILAFSVVGGLLARRRPENLIGWLMATIGLLFAVVVAAAFASTWALKTGDVSKAVGEWLDVPTVAWVPALALIGTQLPLRLPNGKLPSPRWRWFSRMTFVLTALAMVGMATAPGRVENVAGTANPLGSHVLGSLQAVILLLIVCFVAGLGALVVRYRRSDVHDRVQLRWIAMGGTVFLGVYLVTLPLNAWSDGRSAVGSAITVTTEMALAALPLSIGYAILKHRLYDIDAVVNRALVYGALTATLAAAYFVSVLLLQLVLSGVAGGSGLAVAASTLAAAALFRPARARIQQGVDRRFYRRKYDAQRTLESFTARLRDEVDLAALSRDLSVVVSETLQPAHMSLWLRERP